MLISATLPIARRRLVTLDVAAPVIEAARLLSLPDTHLVVACDRDGAMSGVLTKSDIVRQISHCTGCSCTEGVADIMTRDIVKCRPEDHLRSVWDVMKSRALKQVPISDAQSRPIGGAVCQRCAATAAERSGIRRRSAARLRDGHGLSVASPLRNRGGYAASVLADRYSRTSARPPRKTRRRSRAWRWDAYIGS